MKLCVQMGLSQSEVAQHLNLKLSTVKSRLSRGRKELREAFARHCVRRKQSPASATTVRHRKRQLEPNVKRHASSAKPRADAHSFVLDRRIGYGSPHKRDSAAARGGRLFHSQQSVVIS
jgi:hypothetical protein